MADCSWVTSRQLADAAKLNERYVREWLGAMLASNIVEYQLESKTYRLPAEHAACLTRRSGANIAASMQFVPVLGAVEDEVLTAFTTGRGVPYSSYKRFHSVMAEESGQTVVAALLSHILPLWPGLDAQLKSGIEVLDVGCGAGRAMNLLARSYPNSRFTGFDFSDEAIQMANDEAAQHGSRNARFEVFDVAKHEGLGSYDLITAFDAIHDQARPDAVLRNIARALRPRGLFLMQDIKASSCPHKNMAQPMATYIYTISCMHCMSVSLANNGAGLGAAWGKELALTMLAEAGFQKVRVETLGHDIQNYYYLCQL